MSRLIIVSNRVQKPGPDGAQGGLAVALSAALREHKGIWFGWSGETADKFTGHIGLDEYDGVRTATVDLEEQDVDIMAWGLGTQTVPEPFDGPLMEKFKRLDFIEIPR